MFSGMIDETPYDLRWRMFGISCRVHPLFWLVAFIFSYPLLDVGLAWIFAGVGCMFSTRRTVRRPSTAA